MCHFSVYFELEGHFCDLPDAKEAEEVEASLEGDINKLAYCVTDVPPWYLCIFLGIQVSRRSERSLTLFWCLLNILEVGEVCRSSRG